MKILVACEESQAVTKELRRLGHEAYSCDIIECSGDHPEWHIMQDVLPLLNGRCDFATADGEHHKVDGKWDMIIAFPPCTHLAVSGAAWFEKKRADGRQREGVEFFCKFLDADCERVAIENPVGIMGGEYIRKWFYDIAEKYDLPRKPSQVIQPYEFGDPFEKKTCLWLKGLPLLERTNTVEPPERTAFASGKTMPAWYADAWHLPPAERAKVRSKTFPGIAKAMAEQWAGDNRDLGVWIESPACDNICSECGLSADTVKAISKCPNCGKDMRTDYIYPSIEIYEDETGKSPWRPMP